MAPESLLDWSWALVYHINQTDRVVNDLVLVFRICNTCTTSKLPTFKANCSHSGNVNILKFAVGQFFENCLKFLCVHLDVFVIYFKLL